MSVELMELFLERADIDVPDLDPVTMPFVYNGTQCLIESVGEFNVRLRVGDNTIVSDDVEELSQFFNNEFQINESREQLINQLADELRAQFRGIN